MSSSGEAKVKTALSVLAGAVVMTQSVWALDLPGGIAFEMSRAEVETILDEAGLSYKDAPYDARNLIVDGPNNNGVGFMVWFDTKTGGANQVEASSGFLAYGARLSDELTAAGLHAGFKRESDGLYVGKYGYSESAALVKPHVRKLCENIVEERKAFVTAITQEDFFLTLEYKVWAAGYGAGAPWDEPKLMSVKIRPATEFDESYHCDRIVSANPPPPLP